MVTWAAGLSHESRTLNARCLMILSGCLEISMINTLTHLWVSTQNEKWLGQLVKTKYDTNFIINKFSLELHPFYTIHKSNDQCVNVYLFWCGAHSFCLDHHQLL
jgi:hypothetical protein